MPKLNQQQKKAVEHTDGPMIIVAGAGTGKTTVISQKVNYLLQNNKAKPEEILVLAFNDKAAAELLERIDSMVDLGYAEMEISTFHAFCQKILEQFSLDIGLAGDFKLLTQTDTWILIRKNLAKFNLEYYQPLGNPSKHIHELINHFSKCKDELIEPKDYLEYAENLKLNKDNTNTDERTRLTEISDAYHIYNKILLDNNCLDFGDLIYYAVKLFKKRPNILKHLQKRYKYILVDEFQDVNWAQYELVKLLAENSQLSVCGDDDQCLYSFRGASVANILRFKDDYPTASEVILTQNYRSGQNILDIAYQSIQNNNPDRLETKLKINKKLKSDLIEKGEVIHIHKNSLDDEVQAVIDEILKIKEVNIKCTWDDFAILVRANNHAKPFMSRLESAGIPFEFLASVGLYRQPIILDCLNFFKLIDNYHESNAVFRLLRLPFLKFSENDLQKITYYAKRKSISYYQTIKSSSQLKLSVAGVKICDKLISLIHEGMKQARNDKIHRVLYTFLENSGYLEYLAHEENIGNRDVIREINQLHKFFEQIKQFDIQAPDAKVADFMEHFEYLLQSGDQGNLQQNSDTPDSVNIITIHKAKGLEYKYIFVVNLVEDRFPTRRRNSGIEIPLELVKEQLPEGDSHIQEERRLFYVAITRAQKRVYLTSADDYGGARRKKISRFLDEVGFKSSENEKKNKTLKFETISKRKTDNSPLIYEIPKVFSYSQIKSYNTCPYQYKLANIVKLPLKQSHYFSFGNTIHNTLQAFYGQIQSLNSVSQDSLFNPVSEKKRNDTIKIPDENELQKLYKEKWISDWYPSKTQRDKYYKDGQRMLKQYYEDNKDAWTVPLALESGFKIKIGEFLLMGRIDRIDQQKDGTLHIIDYKTGQSKEKPTGEDKEQLIIYQIAASTLPTYINLGITSKLSLYFVKDGIRPSFIGSDKEIEKIKSKVITTLEKIKNQDFNPTPSQHICKNCSFNDICEFKG